MLKLASLKALHWVSIGLYLTMGWLAIVPALKVASSVPMEVVILPALAGLMCSIGTAIYLTQWPNPFPRVFGYHEIFHTLVVISTVILYAVLAIYVLPSETRLCRSLRLICHTISFLPQSLSLNVSVIYAL